MNLGIPDGECWKSELSDQEMLLLMRKNEEIYDGFYERKSNCFEVERLKLGSIFNINNINDCAAQLSIYIENGGCIDLTSEDVKMMLGS